MKKLTGLLLVIALLAAILVLPANAAGNPAITVESVSVCPDKQATVDVSISNNSGFGTCLIELDYDDEVLELKEFTMGAVGQKGNPVSNVTTGKVALVATANITDNGVLFSATFAVKAEGEHTVTAIVKELTDDNGDLTASVTAGKITAKHSFTKYTSNNDATCKADGTETATCDNCTAKDTRTDEGSKVTHKYTNYVSNNDATCTADGTKTAECDYGCGAKDTVTDTGSKLTHKYTKYTSNNDATCTADGTKTAECDYGCGTKDTVTDTGSKLDHKFTNYVSNNDATCTADGTKTAVCDYGCKTKDTVTDRGTKKDHVWQDATCTDPQKCKNCTATQGTALGHTEVIDEAVAATCTETGLTEGKHCSVCETVLVAQRVVRAKGHTQVVDKAVAATCTETGLTEGKHCSVCNEVLTAQTIVEALGHIEVTDKAVEATCTETGLTEGSHCSRCNEALVAQTTVPALGHAEVINKAVAATCTETGLTEGKHCSRCSTILVAQTTVPALGHSWDEGVVTQEPSAEAPGICIYTCTVCKETKTEEIPFDAPSIQRVYGQSRADTALAVADAMKEALGLEKFDSVIIANGEDNNFADALTGSYLATVKKAPILMYRTSGLSAATKAYIQNNLKSGGTVYLLGGELAIPASVAEELSAAGYKVTRLAGGSRFDTNLAILEEAGVGDKEILIARGFEFADSLSASATGLPILMVNEVTGKLTDAQIEFLQKNKDNAMTILGGTIAVSEALEATIEEIVGTDVDRVYGTSREETSVEIAKRYFDAPEFAVIAYSRKCPDGLCGGPLAYAMGAPLLLVNAGQERHTNAYITANEITSGYVLGGTLVITDATARAVFGLAEDAVIGIK